MGNDMGEIELQIYGSQTTNGPGKVVKNLLMGLNKIGVNATYNQNPIPGTKKICLSNHPILQSHLNELFIGPNICVLPIDDSIVMSQSYKKYVVNSDWTYKAYSKWLPKEKLTIWPVGIDTDLFCDKSKHEKTNDCLIYFKRRHNSELDKVIDFLKTKNQTFEVISYGNYSEEHFIKTLEKSKYSIIINNCESQGIAIEEIMSTNTPLLVWDVSYWNDRGETYKFESTSIPYWSDECGVKFTEFSELEHKYNIFLNNFNMFNPRNYILNNLNLENQAHLLLKIVNE